MGRSGSGGLLRAHRGDAELGLVAAGVDAGRMVDVFMVERQRQDP